MNKKFITLLTMAITAITLLSFSTTVDQDNLDKSIKRGNEIYTGNCIACHMENGEGIPSAFPPLAKSDYLMSKTDESIKAILEGARGEMIVNGVTYYGEMAALDYLSDQEVADVMNYIRNTWGNQGDEITPAQVTKLRN